jgi:hypothetical protein
MVQEADSKLPDAHWAMYQNVFGREQPSYLVIIPRKSLSEVDAVFCKLQSSWPRWAPTE